MGKQACEREYRSTKAVSELLECVPAVYEMVEQDGRYGIVFEKISGTDMLQAVTEHPSQLERFASALADYHLAIQKAVDISDLPLLKDCLKRNILRTDDLTEQEKHTVLNCLQALPDGNKLCHMDLHPENVILRHGNPVILDWMTACVGDRCADAARTCLLILYPEMPRGGWLQKRAFSLLKRRFLHGYLKQYKQKSGVCQEQIDAWKIPILAARLSEWITPGEKQRILSDLRKQLRRRPQIINPGRNYLFRPGFSLGIILLF